jgi:hypothetical protein
VSINVELGKHWMCGGVEIAEHRKNTVMVDGCYPDVQVPAVAGTMTTKSYILNL